MNKMKLNSRRQVFKRYGNNLKVEDNISLKLERNLPRLNKFAASNKQPFETLNYSIRGHKLMQAECTICGSNEEVEMHHRRPLKRKITDNTLKGIKVNLSRKQIPLCRTCHMNVHKGKYDGPGIY